MEEDHNIYVKKGRKYVPAGYWFTGQNDWLTEGVWVVTKHSHSTGITNGQYLKEVYGIDKISDLKKPTFAELGGLNKLVDEVTTKIDFDKYRNSTLQEQIAMVISNINLVNDEITPEKLVSEKWTDESTPTKYIFAAGDFRIEQNYKETWKVSGRLLSNDKYISTMKELHEIIDVFR